VRELVIKETDHVNGDLPLADAEEEDMLTELEFIVAGSREENKETMKELQKGAKKRTLVIRFLSMILARAVRKNASDLHIEPRVEAILVRMGVDGILRELMTIPVAHQHSVTTRIKSLAGMDNNTEQRLPQDGRFLMTHKGRRFDVRVSTLPTYFGEKILMRILSPETTIHTFERVGLGKQTEDTLKRLLSLPQGMVIIAGPSGSGKSTTLCAALNAVSSPVKNVITLEDPVEYILDGVTQVQVNPRLGLTAATCLGSIVRQKANIVMIGEIRDAETAEIALRACQAGPLILTTLQANDSISAITRLRDLGIPPYLISSVSGILGQRLLRKLCSCKTEAPATKGYAQSLEALGLKSSLSTMYQPGGCASCENTGYKGRIGIFEILPIDGMMRHSIHAGSEEDGIRAMLQSVGFRNTQADALDKVVQGTTSLEEMMRVVPIDTVTDLWECAQCAHKITSGFRYCPFCGTAVRPDQQPAVRN
jgi:type II secretory ATPase GspE/PulE/Tfp pilus assembly ATPase PilB-like protein